MASGKYLEKSIETESGFTPNCWRNQHIQILVNDSGVIVNLVMLGWKDAAACVAGKAPEGTKMVSLEHAEELPEYQQVFAVFLAKVLADPVFVDAKLKDLPS